MDTVEAKQPDAVVNTHTAVCACLCVCVCLTFLVPTTEVLLCC
jgi:hypothetical protein